MGCHISKPNENANSTETKEDSGAVLLVPADKTRDVLSTGNDSENTPLPYSPEATMEINPEDVVELEHAATKIQATFRGHVARKQAEKVKQEVVDLSKGMENLASKVSGDEEIDVDLSDPDLNKAAVKIQASFRGHMARKEGVEAVIKPPAANP